MNLYVYKNNVGKRLKEQGLGTLSAMERFLEGKRPRTEVREKARLVEEYKLKEEKVKYMWSNGKYHSSGTAMVGDKDVIFARLCEKYPDAAQKYLGYHDLLCAILNV